MPLGPAAVVRFSSLGDVLLAAHVPSFLRAATSGRRVLFVTKERYGSILRGHPDVDRFYLLEDGSSDPAAPAPLGFRAGWADLVAALRRERIAELIDLHQTWRSSRLAARLYGVTRTRSPKHGLRRRLLVHAKWLRPEPLPPLLQTYRGVAGLPPEAPLRPWLKDALTESERGRGLAAAAPHAPRSWALYGVGARWRTKRWPVRHFVALATRVERELGLAPRFALGPEERETAAQLRAALPPDRHAAITTVPVRELAALAAGAGLIVSNDSAILHLGPALGVPAVGIFGSTVPAFGFARQGPHDAVAEIALACRPCAVHGRDRCPLGHHGCMERLDPEIVLQAARPLVAERAE